MKNERIEKALAWCKERKLASYNLILFDKQNKRKKKDKKRKGILTKREKARV